MSKPKLNAVLEPGEIYFIDVGVDSTGGPKLILVDRDESLEGIQKTKLMKAVEGSS